MNLSVLNMVGTLSHRESSIYLGLGTMKVYKRHCLKEYVPENSDWATVTSKLNRMGSRCSPDLRHELNQYSTLSPSGLLHLKTHKSSGINKAKGNPKHN